VLELVTLLQQQHFWWQQQQRQQPQQQQQQDLQNHAGYMLLPAVPAGGPAGLLLLNATKRARHIRIAAHAKEAQSPGLLC
jgi:hypothetical protein